MKRLHKTMARQEERQAMVDKIYWFARGGALDEASNKSLAEICKIIDVERDMIVGQKPPREVSARRLQT